MKGHIRAQCACAPPDTHTHTVCAFVSPVWAFHFPPPYVRDVHLLQLCGDFYQSIISNLLFLISLDCLCTCIGHVEKSCDISVVCCSYVLETCFDTITYCSIVLKTILFTKGTKNLLLYLLLEHPHDQIKRWILPKKNNNSWQNDFPSTLHISQQQIQCHLESFIFFIIHYKL